RRHTRSKRDWSSDVCSSDLRSPHIETTLDAGLQRMVERQVQRYIDQYGDRGIRNAAALLVDTREMSVKAWIGSADYYDESIDGRSEERRVGKEWRTRRERE